MKTELEKLEKKKMDILNKHKKEIAEINKKIDKEEENLLNRDITQMTNQEMVKWLEEFDTDTLEERGAEIIIHFGHKYLEEVVVKIEKNYKLIQISDDNEAKVTNLNKKEVDALLIAKKLLRSLEEI